LDELYELFRCLLKHGDWVGDLVVVLEGAPVLVLKIRIGVSHRRMLASQDFEDRQAGLRAGVVRLEYASLIAVRQVAYRRPETR
jgi:hypothetical protein